MDAFWRSKLIEAATSDEDKVAPVYKLEEVCELLRSSHASIVKEVSEFVFKRLTHKSPIVKQKTLRLIKYCVGKSGVEFRRQMQRQSSLIRELFHYKGQVDTFKGDALNKAVRDTAHEAISAMFATEDDKPSPAEDLNRRIEGFGNTNFEMVHSDDKKSFLSEVVDLGSASLKYGLSSITAANSSLRKSDSGSYKGPVLRRSLTTEMEAPERYERFDSRSETRGSKNVGGGSWGQDSRVNVPEMSNVESSSGQPVNKSREERLLETIVTSGGVRLQPSRDALQVFLVEAAKLDSVSLSRALELKLQSHLWQVRMKAICVLEALLRQRSDTHFAVVASYFSENMDAVVKCSESPQASLREKSSKVLSFLIGDQPSGGKSSSEQSSGVKSETTAAVQMPDLIDAGDSDDYFAAGDTANKQSELPNMTPTNPIIDDLFGGGSLTDMSTNGHRIEEDPFADVSFHSGGDKEPVDDLFSGLTIDDNQAAANKNSHEPFDIFGPGFDTSQEPSVQQNGMHNLVGELSNNVGTLDVKNQKAFSGAPFAASPDFSTRSDHQVPNAAFNDLYYPQMAGINQSATFPVGPMQYNVPQNNIFNQAFASQPMNYGAMGTFIAQQQLLASMSNFQPIGNFNVQANIGVNHFAGNNQGALPDIFNPNIPVQTSSTLLNNTKKEETKAFDFISDHLSAVRDPKRVV